MSYIQRIQLAKEGILHFCRETISERWNNDFDVWLLLESNDDLYRVYKTTFRHHFHMMNDTLKHILVVSASNTTSALRSFIKLSGTPEREEVLSFVETFLNEQMSDFDSLCADCELDLNENI
jgi:hypothetical protein